MAVIRVYSPVGVKTVKMMGLLDEQEYDSPDEVLDDDFAA